MTAPGTGSRVIAVVGACEPIGFACAERFLRDGSTVIGLDSQPADCARSQERLRAAYGAGVVRFVAMRVQDRVAVRSAVEAISVDYGRIDVLIYAASAMEPSGQGLAGLSLSAWHELVEVNLTGLLVCAQEMLPLLRRAEHGSIVVQASVDGHVGNPHVPGYSITKGGQVVMTRMLAAELAGEGIRVNCVAIAGIPIHIDALPDEFRRRTAHATPLGRLGDPGEVAAAIAFLASAEASYITGSSLYVDGGRLAVTPGTSLLDGPSPVDSGLSPSRRPQCENDQGTAHDHCGWRIARYLG